MLKEALETQDFFSDTRMLEPGSNVQKFTILFKNI